MKSKLLHSAFLCIFFIGFATSNVFSTGVQTTFTKSGNVITVSAKPDIDYSGTLTDFVCPFRYLNADGLSFTVTSSYLPATIGEITTDPTDPAYNITTFIINSGSIAVNWTANSEYPIFSFSVSGGLGTSSFSITLDSPDHLYAIYYELNNVDITNYDDPFYPGADNLAITTSGNWKYATENLILGKYWLTTGTADWATGSNWSDGTAPTNSQDVAIIANGTQPIAGNGSVCNKLKIETGSSLQIAHNGSLTINGDLLIADDNALVVKSDATGSGSLIVNGTVPSGNKVNVERYIAGWSDISHGWHFLSSPVAAQAISTFHTPGSSDDFYKWDEPTGLWINRTATGGGLNGDFETNFVVGRGYMIANAATSTKTFVGSLNVADVSVSNLTNTPASSYEGWNLIGNPFSSAMQWNNGSWTLSNVASNCQIWNEANASYSVVNANGIIPAMNGFMVYTSTGGGSLTIPASARTHNATNWYKQTQSDDNYIAIKAVDTEGQTAQETIINFNSEATDGFDMQYDSYFMAGFAPRFYSVSQNEDYALNTLPSLSSDLTIPLGFVKNNSNNFSIELTQNIPGQIVNLVDQKTNQTHLLSGSSYSFTSEAGDSPDRFLLKFGTTGIQDPNASQFHAWVYDHRLYIANNEGNTQINVFDLAGRNLQSTQLVETGTQSIPLNQSAGIYLIRLTNGSTIQTLKVIIK